MASMQVVQDRKFKASWPEKPSALKLRPVTLDLEKEKFFFFSANHSVFSTFYPKTFTAVPLYGANHNPLDFFHVEHWMMYNKALLFGDKGTAMQIISLQEPIRCKALGRKVKRFDELVWRDHRQAILYHGNKHKFLQNPDLFRELQATTGTSLAQASPRDRIYGIGLTARNKRSLNRAAWLGQNLLGDILTRLRDDIC